ncbi:MAG TPA: TldD/PmbA family protein [Candidatus Kapabacteria bacterium]|jgi:predicted Zn-dependent protease|nr:TldD/PmbA family protein [Candidatus Kapabacteria bacterium]
MSKAFHSVDDLESLSEKILSYSTSEWAEVSLASSESSHLRYAANTVTTSGITTNTSVSITSVNGRRAGSVSTNDLSDDGLRAAVRRAEEIASLTPENEEIMPPLEAGQKYLSGKQFDITTSDKDFAANERAKAAAFAILEAEGRKLVASGFLNTSVNNIAYRNTKGLFASDRSTRTTFSTTMRNQDGSSSGWSKRATHAILNLDAKAAVEQASQKCRAWEDPITMDPGAYPAILEPSTVADMLQQLVWSIDARDAEEGRSAFSRSEGRTALNEDLFNSKVHIYSDPTSVVLPGGVYAGGGMPSEKIDWVRDGKLVNMTRDRYWAQKTGQRPVPGPANIFMDGGTQSPEELISTVKEGLLVTSFWYIRNVDDQTLLKTGLTRDGLFWVENGEIKSGVTNFRWNESPLNVLKNVVAMSKPVVTAPRDGWDGLPMMVPMLHVSSFNFSSISDAI